MRKESLKHSQNSWYEPEKTYQDSRGRVYVADKNGSLRRQHPKPTKAERKAMKRARRDSRNMTGECRHA